MNSSSSLAKLCVDRINKQMPLILVRLEVLASHLGFLADSVDWKFVEARDLLRYAHESTSAAIELQHSLVALAEMQSQVRRRDLGDQYGVFKGQYQAIAKKIQTAFGIVEQKIQRLKLVATASLNDPARWESPDAINVMAELTEKLVQVLQFWTYLDIYKKLDK